jgi:predicted methyltransferase
MRTGISRRSIGGKLPDRALHPGRLLAADVGAQPQSRGKVSRSEVFIQADFKKANWAAGIDAGFDLIVSLQAVHELRHASRIPKLYAQLHSLLVPGGTSLICDHVNSSSPSGHRAAHFMTVEEHLSAFKKVGFTNAREICPAADLSLMAAEKPYMRW